MLENGAVERRTVLTSVTDHWHGGRTLINLRLQVVSGELPIPKVFWPYTLCDNGTTSESMVNNLKLEGLEQGAEQECRS
jgi:hypothetical protein